MAGPQPPALTTHAISAASPIPTPNSSKLDQVSIPSSPPASSSPTITHQQEQQQKQQQSQSQSQQSQPRADSNNHCNINNSSYNNNNYHYYNSTVLPLRRHPTDLSTSIPEECDEETNASESSPNEPLTPVSGRQSRDFHSHDIQIQNYRDSISSASAISGNGDQDDSVTRLYIKERVVDRPQLSLDIDSPTSPLTPRPVHATPTATVTATVTNPVASVTTTPPPPPPPSHSDLTVVATTATTTANTSDTPTPTPTLTPTPTYAATTRPSRPPPPPPQPQLAIPGAAPQEQADNKSLISQSDQASIRESDLPPTPLQRSRSRQYSASSIKSFRALFSSSKRTNSSVAAMASGTTMSFREPNYNGGTSETNLISTNRATPPINVPANRRFSYHRTSSTTQPITPPSPESAPEKNGIPMPSASDFLSNNSKKLRAHTGLSLRGRAVNFVTHGTSNPRPQRTKSLERAKRQQKAEERTGFRVLQRQPWAAPPDVGVGMKARRLSLSLPDDFTVDVAELLKEFEYQRKILGRHGKHLGKGATSKVTLMVRKGSPGELVAVKEFRHKSSNETTEEYVNKIKSEFSIAKSLHHPNIVETIRLCTDHGRWNHVMEYCSEGDLFGLVSKKYLKEEGRDVDRLCLFKQLCQGVNYLHSNGIAHRDIKLENLLITKDSKLKITDFGVSEVFTGIHPGLREAGGQCGKGMGEIRLCKPGICGSLPYIAPEVISKKDDYDPRPLDVWSSAVVLIYLCFSACLWEKAEIGSSPSYDQLVSGWKKLEAKKVEDPEGLRDAYPKVAAFEFALRPASLKRLVLQMLHPDPSKRITMKEVITNRWMKSVECCQLESYEDPTKCIDASKKNATKGVTGKIFCHNHLPPQAVGHGLPPMPGKPGY